MGRNIRLFPVIVLFILPFFAYAVDFLNVINAIGAVLDTLIPVFMVLGTVMFLWGVINYLTAAGDEERLSQAKVYMFWGVIGLFAMLTVWGLVLTLENTLGVPRIGIPSQIGSP